MSDHDQQLIEAAMAYLARWNSETLPNIDAFLATVDEALRPELRVYLEEILASDPLPEPTPRSDEELHLAAYLRSKGESRWRAAFPEEYAARSPTLTEVRLQQQLSVGRLAAALRLPIPLLDRLERGGVALTSLPERLWTRLAETLGRSRTELEAILTASQLAANRRLQEGQTGYLSAADGTRIQRDVVLSFGEAFRASAPTAEQQDFWQADLDP